MVLVNAISHGGEDSVSFHADRSLCLGLLTSSYHYVTEKMAEEELALAYKPQTISPTSDSHSPAGFYLLK